MRRITLFLTIFAILSLMWSCKNSTSNQVQNSTPTDEPQYVFTKEDTAEVMSLVGQFIERMENKDIRGAVEMLNVLNGDSLAPLDAMTKRRQAMALNICMGVKYTVNSLTFRTYTDNEVKLDIVLFPKDENDAKPNMTSFFFRPIKFDGKWYLTTKDTISELSNQGGNDN